MTNNAFNVENCYQFYLKKMGLTEERMHEQQRIQVKDAFYGAFGMCLVIMRDELTKIESEELVAKVLQNMADQVAIFFDERVKQSKK